MHHRHPQFILLAGQTIFAFALAGQCLALVDDATIEAKPSVAVRLQQPITDIYLDGMPARQAIELFSRQADIPIVANWDAMEAEGVDPDRPVTLDMQSAPAHLVLELLLQQITPGSRPTEPQLLYEATAWHVQIQTKAQANRCPVVRVMDVSDMLMTIPHFTDAPSLRLDEALQDDGGAVFEAGENAPDEPTAQQRGEQLAATIRQVIEPDIWQAHGGQYASIRYFNGRLIIRAPLYVQRQIAGAIRGGRPWPHEAEAQRPPPTEPAQTPPQSEDAAAP